MAALAAWAALLPTVPVRLPSADPSAVACTEAAEPGKPLESPKAGSDLFEVEDPWCILALSLR